MSSVLRGARNEPRIAPAVPAVSVIIPVRNGARHLRLTLPALRDALPGGWEIVVVDDHSTDDTVAVARLYADRILVSRGQRGGPAARNTGAMETTGAVLVFLDADIRVTRDQLGRLVDGLSEPGVALVFGIYSEGRYLRTLGGRFKNVWVRYSYLQSPARVRWMNTAMAAIRRSDFERSGGYDWQDDWLEGGNDIDFGRIVAETAGDVRLLHDVDCDHLKEMSLWGLLRNDFFRTRGFFRTSMRSREIERVARGRWFGNISPAFMGGVITASLTAAGLLAGGALALAAHPSARFGWWCAAAAAAAHAILALPFYAYALPRLGGWAPLAPIVYLLDHLACALGLAAEGARMLRHGRPALSADRPAKAPLAPRAPLAAETSAPAVSGGGEIARS